MNEPDPNAIRKLLREPRNINWVAVRTVFAVLVAIATIVSLSYPYWPRVKVSAQFGDVTGDPLQAKFEFLYTGGFEIENVEISCEVKFGGRTIITANTLVREPTGDRGQVLSRLAPKSPSIVRTCGFPAAGRGAFPASIEIDVDWHFLTIGHQYFISQPAPDGRCCLMVPESDPLPTKPTK